MEIVTVSQEMIRPFSNSRLDRKIPFKISLIDQLIPSTYSPTILFYPSNNVGPIPHRLKTSLSQTLSHFHPLSGRLKHNLFMDNFQLGIPYIETRVGCEMSQFLRQPQIGRLNDFLPCRSFFPEPNPAAMPQVVIQVNVFDCGGIAIGASMCHKLIDGATGSCIAKSWAATSRGHDNNVENVSEGASALFPPINPLPSIYEKTEYDRWFGHEGETKVNRFCFHADAVAALREKSRSESVVSPSRTEALLSFIWKCAMSASAKVTGSSGNLSMLLQAVSLRSRAKPPISHAAIGNLFSFGVATAHNDQTAQLPMLVKQVRESVEAVDDQFIRTLRARGDYKNEAVNINTSEKYLCSSWLGTGSEKLDFGWGVPIWTGGFGEISDKFMNLITLKKINESDKRIEAWIGLRRNVMEVMEKDPCFLAYACHNPPIIS